MIPGSEKHQRRRVRTLLSAIASIVVLFTVAQLSSIDWDLGARRRQKTAFLLTRQLSAALENFKRQHDGYPGHIQTLHDFFVDAAIAEEGNRSRDFAELSWQHVVEETHGFGYVYEYEPSQRLASDSQLFMHYELHSDPVERAKSGFKSFYVGDNGSIRWNDERRAVSSDPVLDVDPALDMHSYWVECLRRWKKKRLTTQQLIDNWR